MNNPFLRAYQTLYSAIPFDSISTEHYEPAFAEAIRLLDAEIRDIAINPAKPTFANTIRALEQSGELLRRVSSAFFNLLHAEADEEMHRIAQRISPLLTEAHNNIYLNISLYQRVQTLYTQPQETPLEGEDAILLEETYQAFRLHGATLSISDRVIYRQVTTQLNQLTLQFDTNTLTDHNRYRLHLTDSEDLAGIPDAYRQAAEQLAREQGLRGWLFTLAAPSYQPFMRYSSRRNLREQMYRAAMTVGCKGDDCDNTGILRQIANLRLQIANLMGCEHYAQYALQRTMAQTPSAVTELLNRLLEAYRPAALNEYRTLQEYALTSGADIPGAPSTFSLRHNELTMNQPGSSILMPWDWSYYAEKQKQKRYHIDDQVTRPYFELDHTLQELFGLAGRLFGITFEPADGVSVYHPEVHVWQVRDADDSHLALLYTDFHPRPTKQTGAWMNDLCPQAGAQRPHVLIAMNFPRPTDTEPTLLTFDDVRTLHHEFGHALHTILSQCRYGSLSGTNVLHDFVEFPSQLMEQWLHEPQYLRQITYHYHTARHLPDDLIDQLIATHHYHAAYATCRQLTFGFLDMAWHTLTQPYQDDIATLEHTALAPAAIIPQPSELLQSPHFSHIFAGEYAAGYYGYKWAEVLAAHAFTLFRRNGIYHQPTAQALREHLLSRGHTDHPEALYRLFHPQTPTIDALLSRDGL